MPKSFFQDVPDSQVSNVSIERMGGLLPHQLHDMLENPLGRVVIGNCPAGHVYWRLYAHSIPINHRKIPAISL